MCSCRDLLNYHADRKFIQCFKKLIKFYAAHMIPRGIHKWNSLLAYSCSRLKSNSVWHIDIGLINYDTYMHYLYCIYSSNEILRFRKIINTFRVNNLGFFFCVLLIHRWTFLRAYEFKKHCRYIFDLANRFARSKQLLSCHHHDGYSMNTNL